jgi:hypothetical protein
MYFKCFAAAYPLLNYDIGVNGMFDMGFSGEMREEIRQTQDFRFRVRCNSLLFFAVNPLPKLEVYEECLKNKYIDETYAAMDFKTAHIKIPKGSPEYNFDRKDLEKLIVDKTREWNNFAKNLFPKRWQKKFS